MVEMQVKLAVGEALVALLNAVVALTESLAEKVASGESETVVLPGLSEPVRYTISAGRDWTLVTRETDGTLVWSGHSCRFDVNVLLGLHMAWLQMQVARLGAGAPAPSPAQSEKRVDNELQRCHAVIREMREESQDLTAIREMLIAAYDADPAWRGSLPDPRRYPVLVVRGLIDRTRYQQQQISALRQELGTARERLRASTATGTGSA